MAAPVTEGMLLWEPSEEMKRQANLTHYMQWLEKEKGLHFDDPEELWQWSVDKLEDFWASLWEFFQIKASQPYSAVLVERKMPGAQWFPGAKLNYAEHVFRNATTERPALLFQSESQPLTEISWDELYRKVATVAAALRGMGVQSGDRVVSYMPNIPESAIAFLACASIGATWSSCSPDFGTRSVIDRFQQIEPKVLFAVDGYMYNGKIIDRRAIISELQEALTTVQKTIVVPYVFKDSGAERYANAMMWDDMPASNAELTYEQVPFSHPLWVLYSSGTTGLPKAIVQGQGGILLEHLKQLYMSLDLKPEDRFFWYTTTGWMMWNLLLGGLLLGTTVLLYDGSPSYPSMNALWEYAEKSGMTFFGTSAGFILACMKAEIEPGKTFDLSKLRGLGSTGSPLPPEGFQWIYEHVKEDLWLASVSGGTDVCSAFLGGSVLLPVYAGELQCRALGANVQAFDDNGNPLIDEMGELVITEPMPSMPLFFWNDANNKRYLESYFEMYPGVWRHGDWVKITSRGSAVIYGRSDSTINRKGIRMGSSEIYRVVEDLPEVLDSLVIGMERPGGGYYMPLFVVLRPGVELDDALKVRIRDKIRSNLSPHHVPDDVFVIPEVPRTLNGKKLEVPVKKIFMGAPMEKAISVDSMSNPQSMQYFVEFARRLG
ncbi:MAG TPA: acetoacetate--CoA ligase [Ktedonobacteraceae bacterium]|nr:acetoacetate--CoA ligase [Ktedonobacteraceae bacterium]